MKLITGILAVAMMAGPVWAQGAKPAPSVAAKPGAVAPQTAPKREPMVAVKPRVVPVVKTPLAAHAVAGKEVKVQPVIAVAPKALLEPKPAEAALNSAPKPEDKKWAMSGKRDPFFSPVVQQPTGSGCSTGKKCLEIGQINLRGVVKSESGFVAVVTNSLNKAYFLHENDPVFNGYVMRITGDTVVFQETVEDKLGKPFTREVVKKLYTPAV